VNAVIHALKTVFADPMAWLQAVVISLALFALLFMIPVWSTPGNDIAFQWHIVEPSVLFLMALLSVLNGVLFTMHLYIRKHGGKVKKAKSATTLLGIAAASLASTVAVLGLFGYIIASGNPSGSDSAKPSETSTANPHEVAMTCTTDMATQFHIHPQLAILIDGVRQTIPANIGITNGCMNPLHTHDATGTIHVESPVKLDFTLADFFAVWGKTFTKDQILDSKVDDSHVITMTVNGKPSTDFENLVLKDDDLIVISYAKK
jgi:hypothetical protein